MIKIVTLTFVLVFITACTAPVKEPAHSGFLSDYSQLEMTETIKHNMGYISDDLYKYDKLIIDPVVTVYMKGEGEEQFTDEELQDLQEYAHESLVKAFNAKDSSITIVDQPGENVARLRMAITHIKRSIGALNLTIYTKITGAGLGGLAVEGELVDSLTGEQLGATIHWGNGSRVLRAGLTKTGDAKILLKKWSKELKNKLSELIDNQS